MAKVVAGSIRSEGCGSIKQPIGSSASRDAERRFDRARCDANEQEKSRSRAPCDSAQTGELDTPAMMQLWASLNACTAFIDATKLASSSDAHALKAMVAEQPELARTPCALEGTIGPTYAASTSGELSGRIVNGPWAGLELQVRMHAGALVIRLQPASHAQLERLLKAKSSFDGVTKLRGAQVPDACNFGLPFDLKVSDVRLD